MSYYFNYAKRRMLRKSAYFAGPLSMLVALALLSLLSSASLAQPRVVYTFTFPNGISPSSPLTQFGANNDYYGVARLGGSGGSGTIFEVNPTASARVKDVYSFQYRRENTDGAMPDQPLTYVASANIFYGVTSAGGKYDTGTIFTFDPTTKKLNPILNIPKSNGSSSALVLGTDGYLYGTLSGDPSSKTIGCIYRTDLQGDMFDILYTFPTKNKTALFGISPNALTEVNNIFYGTCSQGGQFGEGTLFSYNPTINQFKLLHSFTSPDGFNPNGPLITMAGDTVHLYGTTATDGVLNAGTVFETTTDGLVVTLQFFNPLKYQGSDPDYMFDAGNGNLMGTTARGGKFGAGTIFEYTPSTQTCSVPFQFSLASSGSGPTGMLPFAAGEGYLVACSGGGSYNRGCVVNIYPKKKQSKENLEPEIWQSFLAPNGTYPSSALTPGVDPITGANVLFGTTAGGGDNGKGTVFSIPLPTTISSNPVSLSTLHSFSGQAKGDGEYPDEPVIQDSTGVLYGTTEYGGTSTTGVVYSLAANGTTWSPTIVHSFSALNDGSSNTEGAYPHCSLLIDNSYPGSTSPALVGTALAGGANGFGTIYHIPLDGSNNLTPDYAFGNHNDDGAGPNTLIQDSESDVFYGTTQGTAFDSSEGQYGTIFSYKPGDAPTLLYSFSYSNGAIPTAGLAEVPGADEGDGPYLYGTTQYGGLYELGSLFEYDLATGQGTDLCDFTGANGATPTASLLYVPEASESLGQTHTRPGFLVGSTFGGSGALTAAARSRSTIRSDAAGVPTGGTLFNLDPSQAALKTIANFTGSDGSNPNDAVVEGLDGYFYATTQFGGVGYGTIVQMADPMIGQAWPSSVSVNADAAITLYGIGFTPNAVVTWKAYGATSATVVSSKWVDKQTLQATIPAALIPTSGSYTLTVRDPVGPASADTAVAAK
jgi:uncharacterized repeat protein (TIGR03803 family)